MGNKSADVSTDKDLKNKLPGILDTFKGKVD